MENIFSKKVRWSYQGIEYDTTYFSCKINPNHLGLDVSIYLDSLIAKNNGKGIRVRGQNSGIVATIKNYVLPPNEGVSGPTIFVKYNKSGTNSQSVSFQMVKFLYWRKV